MGEFSGFEVKDSVEFGRFVIARRSYRINDLILDEEPLLMSPFPEKAISYNFSEEITKSTFDCVGCFKSLLPEEVKFCRKCKWPVCCQECVNGSFHAKYECSLFQEKKIGVSPEGYQHIYILRALLMHKDHENPTPWGQFTCLTSSYGGNQKDTLATSVEEIQDATHYLRNHFKMDVDARIVGQIIGACSVNGFEVSGEDQYGSSYRAQAVYVRGSMFAHSCAPNAELVILPYDCNGIKRWHLRVYARRNILCNESINISYIPDCFALDTAARRSYISDTLHFDCKCSRCMDPTEFSFYTEAIICSSCGDETLIVDNPNDEFSTWTCDHCGVCKPYSFAVLSYHASLGLLENCPSQATLQRSLILSKEKFGLNQNHREIIYTKFEWIQAFSTTRFEQLLPHSKDSNEIFVKFMKTAAKCLKVFRMFGKMADIVELESSFAKGIAAYYFKTSDFHSIHYDPYLPEEKLKIVTAICAHLKIAVDTVQWCPYNIMYLHLRQDLIEGYKFWNDLLHDVNADMSQSHSSDELNGIGVQVLNKVDQKQPSPNELNERLPKKIQEELSSELLKELLKEEDIEMLKLDVSQLSDGFKSCVAITSSADTNLILTKPPLSNLTKFDFYFEG